MARSRFLVLLILIASLNANSSESDSPIELAEVHGDVTVQDLFNLSTFLGFHFKIFDYETDDPHCVHFYVDAKLENVESSRHDRRGLCSLGGPQRLTVQWKAEAGLLKFRFLMFRRDIGESMFLFHVSNVGQAPELLGIIDSVPHHKLVFDFETHIITLDLSFQGIRFE